MERLSFIEKETICRLFGICGGYIFKYWSDQGQYNKSKTQQLILNACGIDIFKDKPYCDLSQQKCVEKIWETADPNIIANLLSALSDYFCFGMTSYTWSPEDQVDFRQVEGIIERLRNIQSVSLPEQQSANLQLILEDIESNIAAGKPELVIDRLHTYAANYIREICISHGISVANEKGEHYPLHALVGSLKTWYQRENYFDSEFCVVAIRNTINIFEQYNTLRNTQSAAHPNRLLHTIEAEYAVKVVADTLMFIDKIEKNRLQNFSIKEMK